MGDQRHSQLKVRAPRPKLTPTEEARQAAANGFRQFDRLRRMIHEGIEAYEHGQFELKLSMLSELARLAVDGMVDGPGHFRRGPVEIKGSKHTPPDSDQILSLLEDMCAYVNSKFAQTAWHLAAYVMWRLNWIHPFEDGNGRTSRAASYLVMSVRLKIELPGTPTVPDLIAGEKDPYYQALEAADTAASNNTIDVSEMEKLLRRLLVQQIDGAAGGHPSKFQEQSPKEIVALSSVEDKVAILPSAADEFPNIGIVTMRDDELDALISRMKTKTIPGRKTARHYHVGKVGQQRVAVVRCLQQGNLASQAAVRDFLDDFPLKWILLVGIAGAPPSEDYSLGDVVVSSSIIDFCIEAKLAGNSEFATIGGRLHPEASGLVASLSGREDLRSWSSRRSIRADRPLTVSLAPAKLYGSDAWKKQVRASIKHHFTDARKPLFWTGPVASSDRLVKNTNLARQWRKNHRDLAAIEMEAAGAYSAAHDKNAKLIVIRGISDIVGLKRQKAWTAFACNSAAAFTHALLRSSAFI